MKKLSALLMALVLCLTAFAACAEVELLETEQGLTIAIPTGWRQLELDAEDLQEGYALMMVSGDDSDVFVICVTELGKVCTAQEIVDAMNESDTTASMQVFTNSQGQEMVVYSEQDQTLIGYMLCAADGLLYDFSFLHADGSVLSGDTDLLALAQECMDATCLEEAAEEPAEPETVAIAGGAVELKLVAISDGPVFPVPVNWAEQELSAEDQADGCLAMYEEEATGRTMLIMASELGAYSTGDMHTVMQADEDYATAQLLTNEQGLEVILYVTSDMQAGGYCFVGEDGWLYNFFFGLSDGSNMTQDQVLAELVSYCMNNTCFE